MGTLALLPEYFAALTAILAKLGVDRIDPDLATLIRTPVIVALLAGGPAISEKLGRIGALPAGASAPCIFRL